MNYFVRYSPLLTAIDEIRHGYVVRWLLYIAFHKQEKYIIMSSVGFNSLIKFFQTQCIDDREREEE